MSNSESPRVASLSTSVSSRCLTRLLLALSANTGHPLTDAWCLKLAALHLKHMLENGEDMEKVLVTLQPEELDRYARALQ